jgi:hypothetical protein
MVNLWYRAKAEALALAGQRLWEYLKAVGEYAECGNISAARGLLDDIPGHLDEMARLIAEMEDADD